MTSIVRWLLWLMLVFSPMTALAQSYMTTVTAQVKDANGTLYNSCRYSATLVNLSTSTLTLGGTALPDQFKQVTGTQCDANGNLSTKLIANTALIPNNSQWRFTICDNTGANCFNTQLAITGTTQDITTQVQAAAVILPVTNTTLLAGNNLYTGNNTHAGTETFNGNTIANTTAPLAGLARILSTGASTGVQVIGDSTGNETTEWPYLFMTYLLPKIPATYSIKYWLWNDTNKNYGNPTVIQTGTAGTQRTINFTGSVNGASLLNAEVPTFSGASMDLRAHLCLASWRPTGAVVSFLSKYDEPFREVRLTLLSTGVLQIETTPTGSSAQNDARQSTVALPDVGANGCQWVRATWNAGAINFYTSSDSRYYTDASTTWTQAGATVTTPNTTFYAGPGSDWKFGVNTVGTSDGIEIRDGVNGPVLNARNIDAWFPIDTGTTFTGAPEFNVVNGSEPGAGIPYFTAASAAGFSSPNWSQAVTFVSLSHNELVLTGFREMLSYATLFKQLTKYIPLGHLVVLTQNPRTAPTTNIAEQAIRRAQLMSWNASPVGYDVIDTYGAFLADPRWATSPGTLVNPADGIHPTNGINVPGNTEGMKVWEAAIEAAFARSAVSTGSEYANAPTIPTVWPISQGGTGSSTATGTGQPVLASSPSISTPTITNPTISGAAPVMQNLTDTDLSMTIKCGLTVDKNCWFTYRGFNNTAYWQVGKGPDNSWQIFDNQANIVRINALSNGQLTINGVGATGLQFNANVGASGIVRFFSGSTTPAQVAVIDNTGALFFSQSGTFNGKIHGTFTAVARDFNFPDVSGNVPVTPAAVTAGRATCWKTTTTIGYCSTQPDATGACTCN